MKWYKRDPAAALEGMIGLTAEERGYYNTLLDLLYARAPRGTVTDELVVKAMAERPQVWRRVKAALILKGKVRETHAKLTANRVETELKLASNRLHWSMVSNAKRWKNNELGHPIPDSKPQPQPQPEKKVSTPRSRQERERGKSNGRSIEEPQGFAQFWTAYPRKVARPDAIRAFTKAIRQTTLEAILAAIARQQRDWIDPKFIPYPASWLNKARWADESSRMPRWETGPGGL